MHDIAQYMYNFEHLYKDQTQKAIICGWNQNIYIVWHK